MPFVSITRLRVRSVWFMPLFALYTHRSLQQVRAAAGFQGGELLPDRGRTFWTMTAWQNAESMRQYMISGPHKAAMPRLMHWCDEASVVHWISESNGLPSWTEADSRMRTEGRTSKVLHPSPEHANLSFRAPRLGGSAKISPKT